MDNPYNREITCFCPICKKVYTIRGIISTLYKSAEGIPISACANHPAKVKQHSFVYSEQWRGKAVLEPTASSWEEVVPTQVPVEQIMR